MKDEAQGKKEAEQKYVDSIETTATPRSLHGHGIVLGSSRDQVQSE